MGQLLSSAIPNLISGVSQQPWNVRLPTQAEEQVNCHSSVTDFLRRRPSTRHITRIADTTKDILAIHHINRDDKEKYLVLASGAGVRVFDLEGHEKTVNMHGSPLNYLGTGIRPDKDLRFLTINDYTFVANRAVTVLKHGTISHARPPEALVFIKQASYNTTYAITLDGNAYTFATLDGLAPADQPADRLSSAEIAESLANQIRNFSMAGVNHSGTFSGTWNGILNGEAYDEATDTWVPQRQLMALFVGDGLGAFSGNVTASEWTPEGGITGGLCNGLFGGLSFSTGPYTNWRNCNFTGTVQGTFSPGISAAGHMNAFLVDVSNSTLWIRRKDGGDFTIKVADTRSNTHISVCKGTVQRFSDLPVVAPRGFVTEITGDATSAFDNYYCVFEPTDKNDNFGTGIWKECVKPGIPCQLNDNTMPHALIRQADGTFTFGPLEWGLRKAGDEKSAPFPSFVGKTINSLFFYRNRLSFLSGENLVMSETGEFFNFFLTTVTTLVDSDVIDVAASHVKSNILEHACVFSGGLLLFSGQSQFVLEHDTVLSNSTVSVKPVTEFEADTSAVPVSSGKTVFFAVRKGEFSGVREYFTMPDASDQNDAADVTAHVPRYIRGNVASLTCSSNEDILLVLSEQHKQSLWMYKYFWNGAEKIQSSWSRWDMAGEVLAAVFDTTTAYLVMRYTDGLYLESVDFEPGHKDAGAAFEYCLDRKVTEASTTNMVFEDSTKTTLLTLPYPLPEGRAPVLVTRPDGSTPGGHVLTVLDISPDRQALRIKGDIRTWKFYAGLSYLSSYTFSPFAIREDGKGNAVTTGRLQLRSLALSCADTGYLRLCVTPAFRPPSVYTFTGRELGHGTNILGRLPLYTGTIKCPVLAANTAVQIRAESDSFLPFSLVNASWEGFYNSRHRRV